MNLKPLSPEQQKDAIGQQLSGNNFFSHLQQFSEIRKQFDRIYYEYVCPTPEQREQIEKYDFNFALGMMAKDCGIAADLVGQQIGDAGVLIPQVSKRLAAATDELGYYADYTEATKHMERITAAEFNKPAK